MVFYFAVLVKEMNRKYSLKKNHEIEKLFKDKLSVGNKFYAIYYQIITDVNPKIAFSISKRIKTAVLRNYEKRITKEIFRNKLKSLENLKMLVVVKAAANDLTYLEKEMQISYLIKKILRRKNEETN